MKNRQSLLLTFFLKPISFHFNEFFVGKISRGFEISQKTFFTKLYASFNNGRILTIRLGVFLNSAHDFGCSEHLYCYRAPDKA